MSLHTRNFSWIKFKLFKYIVHTNNFRFSNLDFHMSKLHSEWPKVIFRWIIWAVGTKLPEILVICCPQWVEIFNKGEFFFCTCFIIKNERKNCWKLKSQIEKKHIRMDFNPLYRTWQKSGGWVEDRGLRYLPIVNSFYPKGPWEMG